MKDLELDPICRSMVHELIKELNGYIMCMLTYNYDGTSHMHAHKILTH